MTLVDFNARDLIAGLNDFEKTQLPFAISKTLTDAAKLGQRDLQDQLAQNLDRPTPFTMRAVYLTSANKKDFPNASAAVGIKTGQAKYLEAEFVGGARKLKPFEAKLTGKNRYVKAPATVKRDAYGNVSKRDLLLILAAAKNKQDQVFEDKNGTGIYQRQPNGTLKALLFFQGESPNYTQALNLQATQRVIEDSIPAFFETNLTKAIQTARL